MLLISIRLISNHEFFIRLLLQLTLCAILYQIAVKNFSIVKAIKEAAGASGRTKFKHWFYDVSFGHATAISIFSVCLFFSVIVPMILPIGAFYFTIKVSPLP